MRWLRPKSKPGVRLPYIKSVQRAGTHNKRTHVLFAKTCCLQTKWIPPTIPANSSIFAGIKKKRTRVKFKKKSLFTATLQKGTIGKLRIWPKNYGYATVRSTWRGIPFKGAIMTSHSVQLVPSPRPESGSLLLRTRVATLIGRQSFVSSPPKIRR